MRLSNAHLWMFCWNKKENIQVGQLKTGAKGKKITVRGRIRVKNSVLTSVVGTEICKLSHEK